MFETSVVKRWKTNHKALIIEIVQLQSSTSENETHMNNVQRGICMHEHNLCQRNKREQINVSMCHKSVELAYIRMLMVWDFLANLITSWFAYFYCTNTASAQAFGLKAFNATQR